MHAIARHAAGLLGRVGDDDHRHLDGLSAEAFTSSTVAVVWAIAAACSAAPDDCCATAEWISLLALARLVAPLWMASVTWRILRRR